MWSVSGFRFVDWPQRAVSAGRGGCGDAEAVVAVREAGPAEAAHGRTDIVGQLALTAAASDTTGNVFPIPGSDFGTARAQAAVDGAAENPVATDPRRTIGGRSDVVRMRVVLAPLHHIANHVIETEGVLFFLPDRMGASAGVIVLFLDPS